MFKHLIFSVAALLFVFSVSTGTAAASSIDAILLKIDAMVLEMELLKREVKALQSGGASPAPSVLGAQTSGPVFTQSLEYGETNDDIERIQKLLATDPVIYPYGVASGFFGPKTQEAIRNLQTRWGLDPVGVIGPSTTELLERIFKRYPTDNYPDDVLAKKPAVLGVSTTATTPVSTTPSSVTTPTVTKKSSVGLESVAVETDRGEAYVEVEYSSGSKKKFTVEGDDDDEIIEAISDRIGYSESEVEDVLDIGEKKKESKGDYDEDEAEEAIEDAVDAIRKAEDDIEEAEDDDEDTDYAEETLEDAEEKLEDAEDAFDDEEYDDAGEFAKEAEDLARDARDRIGEEDRDSGKKGDSDEITNIEVDVDVDESEAHVEYENDKDYWFKIDEDKIDEIIEEVADELGLDEDEVEDVIEFDFGKIDEIEATIEDDEAEVVVTYKSGVVRRFVVDEGDEDDIIEEVADELDEDEDEIEDIIDFDYN